MYSDFTIIEDTIEAQQDYGIHYGASFLTITKKDIAALLKR